MKNYFNQINLHICQLNCRNKVLVKIQKSNQVFKCQFLIDVTGFQNCYNHLNYYKHQSMNNYHIYEEVGRGKYSVVYKGRKKKSIEYVAVKSVERGRRKKLMDEVAIFQIIQNDHLRHSQSNSQLGDGGQPLAGGGSDPSSGSAGSGGSGSTLSNWHPNILKFYNWYETRNHFWIILEHCVGGDLQSLLEQDKKLPEDTVKKFAYEMLEGLSYLHSQGIIFGDLKPSNILMNEYCKLKLCDFGLAKKVTDLASIGMKNSAEERASSHSQASQSAKNKSGTPYYMAPELFQDSGVYSYQSDFWSLGCILVELATGKPPFFSNTLKELIHQIRVQDVPVVRHFSPEFNDLVHKILQKDPVNRIWWDELKKHPWWTTPIKDDSGEKKPEKTPGSSPGQPEGPYSFDNLKKQTYSFTKRLYQPQLQFEKYLQNVRKIDPQAYYQARQRGGIPRLAGLAQEANSHDSGAQNLPASQSSARANSGLEQRALMGQPGMQQLDQQFQGALGGSSLQPQNAQAQLEEENDAYNNHIQSRTKSMRNQAKMKAAEELQQQQQKADEARGAADFYGRQGQHAGIQGDGSSLQADGQPQNAVAGGSSLAPQAAPKTPVIDRGDRRFGQLGALGGNHDELKRQHTVQSQKAGSPLTGGPRQHESRAPSNPASGRQGQIQQVSQMKNPNVVKQNNFFSPTHPPPLGVQAPSGQSQLPKRTTSPKPPQNPGSGQNYPLPAANFNKNNTQQIFQNKTLGGIGQVSGGAGGSLIGVGGGASALGGINERKNSEGGVGAVGSASALDGQGPGASGRKDQARGEQESKQPQQQVPKQPLQQSKQIDRLMFLDDRFEHFEELEEGYVPMDHSLERANGGNPNDSSQNASRAGEGQWVYHEPMDAEQAFSTLRMIKDMTLFTSPLSQAQIKAETQTLVTQTVQIGPVQNQGGAHSGPQGGSTAGGSSFSNSNSLGRNPQSDGNSFQSAKAHTLNSSDQSSIQNSSGLGMSSVGGGVSQPTQMKVPHKTIEQLIIHNSDTAVKPIVGNKEIERIHDPPLNTQHLQFTPWTSDDVIEKINTAEIESHLSDVYTSIASNTTINEKISTLQYFESIIVNSNVSNSLINSAFMALLKKMLEQIKSPMIKIRVCSVVGLLIRHSTIIDNELAEIDIASQLIETLRDSNEKVRRRAIAALGEYMFYAATQLDDEMADPVWELSDDAIDIIVQSLDEQETDNIVRFYACKTLENICAQSTSAGHRFATPSTVQHVLNIFLMEKDEQPLNSGRIPSIMNHGYEDLESDQPQDLPSQSYLQWYEGIKISAAIALSHICKLNPQLFPVIFETITPIRFCETLLHGNGQYRVQQAFITMLNLALHNIYYPQISAVLLKEPTFFQALQKLLEHQHIVIRGKCILTFLLLFKLDFRWMTAVQQEIKFFLELDKMLKDNYKYVQCCLLCLAEGVQDIIPTIFKTVCEQLIICVENSRAAQGMIASGQSSLMQELEEDESNLDFERKKEAVEYVDFSELTKTQLYHITILLDLQLNPLIRSRLLSTPTVQAISAMLDVCDAKSFRGSPQFSNSLLIFAENLSLNPTILAILAEPIVALLIPVLFHKVINSGSLDIKSVAFKIYTDIMSRYLSNDSVFQGDSIVSVYKEILAARQGGAELDNSGNEFGQQQRKNNGKLNQILFIDNQQEQKNQQHILAVNSITKQICEQLLTQLLPSLPHILTESDDPLPMFGLKLLAAAAERDGAVITEQMVFQNQAADKINSGNNNLSLKQILASFYDLNRPNRLNRHTLNLVRVLITRRAFSVPELRDYKILPNTTAMIYSMLENQQEQSLEIMLDILHELLSQLNDLVIPSEETIADLIDQIFNNFEPCIHLLNVQFDISLVEKASQCLIQILQLFAQSKLKRRDIYFTESHFPYLLSALKHSSHRPLIQKRMLKCVYWALIQNEYRIDMSQVDKEVIQGIEAWVRDASQGGQNQSRDKGIVQTSREVWKLLRQGAGMNPSSLGSGGAVSGSSLSQGISGNGNSSQVNQQQQQQQPQQQASGRSAQGYSQYSQYSQAGHRQ